MAKKNMKSMTGTEASAYTAYAFTEVAGIYPITPSTPIAEQVEAWAAKGQKNIFGQVVDVVEMQSEAGAAGMVHGAIQAGALASTYTASQGLLLMIPNIYKLAGQKMPAVFHVAARSLATAALSIFGDHQDVYAARQTGAAMICSSSVQAVMDLGGVAHLSAIEASAPFIHFFDGFRTSHEISKIETIDYSEFAKLVNKKKIAEFKKEALRPDGAKTRGTAANDDIYFQLRESQNEHFDAIPGVVADYMKKISDLTGRTYAPFVYTGAKDAEHVIVAMGSVSDTIKEVVEFNKGKKIGFVEVMLYRPFSIEHLMKVLPTSVKTIAVLDRTKENGSIGEPLYLDILAAVAASDKINAKVVGGRYGLSSKDTVPGDIQAVYDMLAKAPKHNFTLGINDDVTKLSLPRVEGVDTLPAGTTELLFYGLGSDGTVSANKNTIKIIGDKTDNYAQGYFQYDSKKAGGVTRSHLRFGPAPITSEYYVKNAHFIACSNDSYLFRYDMVSQLREGGTFLLNTVTPASEIEAFLPNSFKKALAEKKAKFYIIDAVNKAKEIGMGSRTNTILQSAFFSLNEQIIPYATAVEYMKEYVLKSFGKKGEEVVNLNYKAIDVGPEGLEEIAVNADWAKLAEDKKMVQPYKGSTNFVKDVAFEISSLRGDDLPTSTFAAISDGTIENGTSKFEKRDVASFVPDWEKEKCVQCNICSLVCPHAVVRANLLDDAEMKKAPKEAQEDSLDAKGPGLEKYKYRITVSPLDCTGCALCVEACPTKALSMKATKEVKDQNEQAIADFMFDVKNVAVKDIEAKTFKDSQFARPAFEFSGACAGCGETNYVKLVTQLFPDNLMIANATGCSSIYGGTYPSGVYTEGVSWANSLFEDNAEFGFGMRYANDAERKKIITIIEQGNLKGDAEKLAKKFLEVYDSSAETKAMKADFIAALEKDGSADAKAILALKDFINKPVLWMIGGDGWAYDIGYGGLDHVLASNQDVNILVLDTEVYSNTGGQSSKSSQSGSIAKLAAGGKDGSKKNFGAISMSYGHIYVASVSMGSNPQQVFNAFKEAAEHKGPSIVFAYSPCIEHGIAGGLTNTAKQQKLVVNSGYWPLYRYNPSAKEGQPKMHIDSKPNFDLYPEVFKSERRYSMLAKTNPEKADELLAHNIEDAKKRFKFYEDFAKSVN